MIYRKMYKDSNTAYLMKTFLSNQPHGRGKKIVFIDLFIIKEEL